MKEAQVIIMKTTFLSVGKASYALFGVLTLYFLFGSFTISCGLVEKDKFVHLGSYQTN